MCVCEGECVCEKERERVRVCELCVHKARVDVVKQHCSGGDVCVST